MPVEQVKPKRDTIRAARPPLIVAVRVFNLETGEQEQYKTTDYINGGRTWINNLMVWAVTNGKGVQVCNLNDDKEDK